MTVILESTRQQRRRGFGPFYCTAASNGVPNVESAALDDLEGTVEPSERDVITVLVLRTSMQHGTISADEASAFLLHTAALQYLPLANRRPSNTAENTAQNLVCSFTRIAASLLRNEGLSEQLDVLDLPVNLADLLDGFLLTALTRDACLRNTLLANTAVKNKYDSLLSALIQASGNGYDGKLSMSMTADNQVFNDMARCYYSASGHEDTVLSFRNAVFDKHLAPVRLHLNERFTDGATSDNVKVFQ